MNLKNILVPVEFTDASQKALAYALPFARTFGARITLLHAIEMFSSFASDGFYVQADDENALAPAVHKLEMLAAKSVAGALLAETLACVGSPFEVITNVAREWEIDLIIMATQGSAKFKHFSKGGIIDRVVREAPCPVLVVHPAGNNS